MLHRLSLLLLLLCSAIVAPDILRVYDMKAWGIWKGVFHYGDGFVNVYCNERHIGTTEIKKNTRDPVWEKDVWNMNASPRDTLKLRVYDKNVEHDDHLGTCVKRIKRGSYEHTCYLFTGGMLKYRYFLM